MSTTIRVRLQELLANSPDQTLEATEACYQLGCRSWPAFVREIRRAERSDEIEIEWQSEEEVYLMLPADDRDVARSVHA